MADHDAQNGTTPPPDAEARNAPRYAEVDDVRRVAASWSTDHLLCRDVGHHWVYQDATHVRAARFFRVIYACTRCEMRRTRELSESGHVFATSYQYPDGYVAVGLGRIVGEAKDAMRLEAIMRGALHEVKRRNLRADDLPRFGATRRALDEEGND